MMKLGYFLHVTPSGEFLVKITGGRVPRLGWRVVNGSGKLLGKVRDIIGPVRAPYAVVKPAGTLNLKPYEEVFVKPSSRRWRK
ncbi:MAG: hypothetical protein J7L55_02400 [Desulfurococcales archaeon]|nr:hypothetical protein [Desulfurococcales archaeon]